MGLRSGGANVCYKNVIRSASYRDCLPACAGGADLCNSEVYELDNGGCRSLRFFVIERKLTRIRKHFLRSKWRRREFLR